MAAGLAALALMTAFQKVVAQVVVQASQERAAFAVSIEIASNCKLMHDPVGRDQCLVDLSAAHRLRTSNIAPAPLVIAKTGGEEPPRN